MITKADIGIIEKIADMTISLRILLELAFTIPNNEVNIKANIVKEPTNKTFRFSSPDTLAKSSTKKTAMNPIIPKINDSRNHFGNYLF